MAMTIMDTAPPEIPHDKRENSAKPWVSTWIEFYHQEFDPYLTLQMKTCWEFIHGTAKKGQAVKG